MAAAVEGGSDPGAHAAWSRRWRRAAAEDGYSLVELLVVLAILGLVLGALTTLFVSASRAQLDMSDRFEAQQNARLALDTLRRELHCAKAVTPTTGYPVSSITVTLGSYCPAATGTKSTAALTVPFSGTFTINVTSTAAFPLSGAPATVVVSVGNSLPATCADKTATSFTLCTGGSAGNSYPAGTAVSGTQTFTFCTKDKNMASPPTGGSPFSIWRYAGTQCSGDGRRFAGQIADRGVVTGGQIFRTYAAAAGGTLGVITVDIPVNTRGSSAGTRWYELKDDIVLRNSPR